jgi:NADPH-dependent ferric siderophore reductase
MSDIAAQSQPEGLVSRLLSPLLFRRAQLVAKQQLAQGLYHIKLQGPELRHQRWSSGDKIQIKVGGTLITRTYTPFRWDNELGQTEFIAHSLTDGPGSLWVSSVQIGQDVSLFGPRHSLNLTKLDATNTVMIGDETAIGLALAFNSAHTLLEVADAATLKPALARLGLSNFTLYQRPLRSGMPEELIQDLPDYAHRSLLLAGRAASIKQLQRLLREQGAASSALLSKVYWADGKTGLD